MKRSLLSVQMDQDLLDRVDLVAEAREENRSEVVRRVLINGLLDEERSAKLLMDPVIRATVLRVFESPKLVGVLAKVFGDELSPEQRKGIAREASRLKNLGERRAGKGKAGQGRLAGGAV